MQKENLIEKHLREKGLEMKEQNSFVSTKETDSEILHQRLTSYILFHLGIKRSRVLSDYYNKRSVFLK